MSVLDRRQSPRCLCPEQPRFHTSSGSLSLAWLATCQLLMQRRADCGLLSSLNLISRCASPFHLALSAPSTKDGRQFCQLGAICKCQTRAARPEHTGTDSLAQQVSTAGTPSTWGSTHPATFASSALRLKGQDQMFSRVAEVPSSSPRSS